MKFSVLTREDRADLAGARAGHRPRVGVAVATSAPKTRANGEIFEEATNSNFLAFGKDKKTCPNAAALAQRLNEAEQRLSSAFAQK